MVSVRQIDRRTHPDLRVRAARRWRVADRAGHSRRRSRQSTKERCKHLAWGWHGCALIGWACHPTHNVIHTDIDIGDICKHPCTHSHIHPCTPMHTHPHGNLVGIQIHIRRYARFTDSKMRQTQPVISAAARELGSDVQMYVHATP